MTKVLVIDDMDDITFSLKKALSSIDSDFEVESLNQFSVENVIKQTPDIILMDLMMPGKDGWQAIKELHNNESTKNIPIIIITAKDDLLSEEMGLSMVQGYLKKPANINELHEKIRSVLKL